MLVGLDHPGGAHEHNAAGQDYWMVQDSPWKAECQTYWTYRKARYQDGQTILPWESQS